MQLDRITLQLRRRKPWEALDLGHAMLRAWAKPAYRAWMAFYWPVALLLMAVFWQWPTIGFLVLWWLKPLFDRVLLFTYSRSLFGQPTAVRDVWRALPGILKGPGVIAGLTWRRFSLARSFLLPVWQLEGQEGADARKRFKVLGRRARGHAVWLTFVCANMVTILGFSLVLLCEMLAPVGTDGLFSLRLWVTGGELPNWQQALIHLLWIVAETLVEPLYVASGFALYLNRRNDLEGWDIDIAFRRMAAHRQTVAPGMLGLLAAVLLGFALFAGAPPAEAGTTPAPAKQVIDEVLADPVFGKETEEMRWMPKPSDEKPESAPDWLRNFVKLFGILGEAMRGLVFIVLFLLAAFLIYLLIRYRERWLPTAKARPLPPDFLFGLDVRPDSLPADVASAARAALAAGRVEEALSLLYRGALVALIHRLHIEFKAGDTENDCLRRVDRHLEPDAHGYFGQLLEAWRSVAYARHHPPAPVLESLCDGWARHFGRRGAAA